MDQDSAATRLRAVLAYHQTSKHGLQAYAPGPGRLDWATQPDPFRRYAGARLLSLETIEPQQEPRYDALFERGSQPRPAPLNRSTVSQLLFDSLALSAWKQFGGSRWALRVNASSGNLHPTEGYLICASIEGLNETPMVAHYAPREHALEVRAEFDQDLWGALAAGFPAHTLFLGLSSIHWREAWKYGQRAYRYCMHDAGHAIGAVAMAAASLGWRCRLLDELGAEQLARLLGTSQPGDAAAEPEEPDALLACFPGGVALQRSGLPAAVLETFANLAWQGCANQLSPAHLDWHLDDIAAAVRRPPGAAPYPAAHNPAARRPEAARPVSARRIIRQRRSAVAMDGRSVMSRGVFYRMLGRTLAAPGVPPFDCLPWDSKLHLALFVHRVEGLAPGLYLLVREAAARQALQTALSRAHAWARPADCPSWLPLFCLQERDVRELARQLACGQDIASDGCFSLAMLAEFEAPLRQHGAWFYPRLFWEAGLIGQLLYLEAEAAGLRATGIGCYFDDPMHDLLGLQDQRFQDLYHFTCGGAVQDTRIATLPAYSAERARRPQQD